MIPWPEYAPDKALLDPSATDNILNVLPTETGYRPMPSMQVYSEALPEAPRGGILAVTLDGGLEVIVMGAVGAYQLESDLSWTTITRQSGGVDVPYNLAAGDTWSLIQFGDRVIAANVNDPIQRFDLASSTKMEALAGSPPQVRYLGVSGDYILAASTSTHPSRVHRSGYNNTEYWQFGQGKRSDYQDLPDGGAILGMTGSERGAVIFQRDAIRVLEDQPTSPALFSLAKVDPTRGAIAPHSIVSTGATSFYLAEGGFRAFSLQQGVTPIGDGRVDRTVLADMTDIEQVQGAFDPNTNNVYWRYESDDGTNKIIGFSPKHNRWFPLNVDTSFILKAATVSTSLEAISSVHGYTSLEDVPFSLDASVWRGGRPLLAGFNASHQLGLFLGASLEATLETSDMPLGGEGRRAYVSGFRPVGDVTGASGQVIGKATYGSSGVESASRSQNNNGSVPLRAQGQTLRFRLTIPAGSTWRHALGVEPEGLRRAGRQ